MRIAPLFEYGKQFEEQIRGKRKYYDKKEVKNFLSFYNSLLGEITKS